MTFEVVVEPGAERDIRTAALWILGATGSRATALRWVRSLRARLGTLASTPHRCPNDPDSDMYGEQVRVLLFGKRRGVYRVLYAIRGTRVHVLTVRHAARASLAEEMNEGGEPVP